MPEERGDVEKRRSRRFALISSVDYRFIDTISFEEVIGEGRLINVSEGGFCMSIDRVLSPSQVVKVDLPLRQVEVKAPAIGQVVWVEKRKEEEFIAGFRFIFSELEG